MKLTFGADAYCGSLLWLRAAFDMKAVTGCIYQLAQRRMIERPAVRLR